MQYEPIIVVPPHHITVPTVYKQVHTHNLIKKTLYRDFKVDAFMGGSPCK